MKKIIYGVFAFAAVALFTACSNDNSNSVSTETTEEIVQDFSLNTAESSLEWTGSWVGGESDGKNHVGSINITEGNLHLENGVYEGGFAIDMSTIEDKSVEDETYREKLNGHLKSSDYFNVEAFPVTKVEVEGFDTNEAKVKIYAFGLEFERTLPIQATFSDDKAVLSGEFDIDFTEANMPGTQLNPEAPESGAVSSTIHFVLNATLDKN